MMHMWNNAEFVCTVRQMHTKPDAHPGAHKNICTNGMMHMQNYACVDAHKRMHTWVHTKLMHRQDDAHAKLCEGGCTQNGCIDGIIQAICRAMDAHKNECTDRMMHRYIDAQTEGRTDTYTE